jgi:hypothetical protein
VLRKVATQLRLGPTPGPGTPLERVRVAEEKLRRSIPRWTATIDRLLQRVIEIRRNGEDPTKLEEEIRGIDTRLRVLRLGPAAIVGSIAYLYWNAGLSSAEVASELGISPGHVRQTLHRLGHTFARQRP